MTKKTNLHPCGTCRRMDKADNMIYSPWTQNHYCGAGQIAACEKRAAALKRRKAKAAPEPEEALAA